MNEANVIIISICAVIITVAICCTTHYTIIHKEMVNNGYEQVQKEGTTSVRWQIAK